MSVLVEKEPPVEIEEIDPPQPLSVHYSTSQGTSRNRDSHKWWTVFLTAMDLPSLGLGFNICKLGQFLTQQHCIY